MITIAGFSGQAKVGWKVERIKKKVSPPWCADLRRGLSICDRSKIESLLFFSFSHLLVSEFAVPFEQTLCQKSPETNGGLMRVPNDPQREDVQGGQHNLRCFLGNPHMSRNDRMLSDIDGC